MPDIPVSEKGKEYLRRFRALADKGPTLPRFKKEVRDQILKEMESQKETEKTSSLREKIINQIASVFRKIFRKK